MNSECNLHYYASLVPDKNVYVGDGMIDNRLEGLWASLSHAFIDVFCDYFKLNHILAAKAIGDCLVKPEKIHCTVIYSSNLCTDGTSKLVEKYGENYSDYKGYYTKTIFSSKLFEMFSDRKVIVISGCLGDKNDRDNVYNIWSDMATNIKEAGGTMGDIFSPHITFAYVDKLYNVYNEKAKYPVSKPIFQNSLLNVLANSRVDSLMKRLNFKFNNLVTEVW